MHFVLVCDCLGSNIFREKLQDSVAYYAMRLMFHTISFWKSTYLIDVSTSGAGSGWGATNLTHVSYISTFFFLFWQNNLLCAGVAVFEFLSDRWIQAILDSVKIEAASLFLRLTFMIKIVNLTLRGISYSILLCNNIKCIIFLRTQAYPKTASSSVSMQIKLHIAGRRV